MIDLKKARLPDTIEVDGKLYPIHTSFKYWLCFLELIADNHTPPADFDFMYIQEKPQSRINGLVALVQFCNPPQKLPRTQNDSSSTEKAVDYTIDADYIYSAFLEQYGIDLVESNGLKIDCEAVTLPQFIDTDAKGYTTYAESVKCTFLEE